MNAARTMHCRVVKGAFALGLLALTFGSPAHAGGNLEIFDFTNAPPSPIAGHVIATTRGMRFDARCLPLAYHLDTKVDPIPNGTAGAPQPLPLAQAKQAIEQALASWNDIPTSFVEMRIVGSTQGGAPGAEFDFINEVSFEVSPTWSDGVIAASRSVYLVEDGHLLHGEDLDGDGDGDVSSATLTCADVDGDGDIELPEGFYRAGTILENDVVFDPRWEFTTDLSGLDHWLTQDLVGVAAHEFGHSLGLPHSAIAQRGPHDGRKTTMWYAPGDPVEKAATRELHSDEIAWASFLYPEGSQQQGLAALQRGDRRFDAHYAVLRGEVHEASGRPGTGSLVFAEDLHGNVITSAIAGRFRLSFGPTSSAYLPSALAFADGRYALPVPKGVVRVGVEPNDTWPDPTRGTTPSGIYPFFYDGSQEFIKEYYNGAAEGRSERHLGQGLPLAAFRDRDGIDFALDDNVLLGDDDPWVNDFSGISVGPQGVLLALRIPREEVMAIASGRGLLVQAALFGTFPWISSEVAVFDGAMITTGRISVNGQATIEVAHPLARQTPFIGLDFDHTPLYVNNALALGEHVQRELPALQKDLFLVLAVSNVIDPAYPGISRYGVLFDLLAPDSLRRGRSYYSRDGGQTWNAENPNVSYAFSLVVAPR
jgi:hypothetical protein